MLSAVNLYEQLRDRVLTWRICTIQADNSPTWPYYLTQKREEVVSVLLAMSAYYGFEKPIMSALRPLTAKAPRLKNVPA